MKLEIFDKYTRLRIGMIKAYTYASYEDEFFGGGTFSIKMPVSDESVDMLAQGNYILFDEGVVGIVKGMRDTQETDEEVEVYGYLTNHILSYRSFFLTTRYYDRIPAVFRQMATDLFIDPEDEKRKIPYVTLSEDYPVTEKKYTVQRTGDTFLETLSDLSMTHDLGFRLHPVIEDVNPDTGMPNLSAFEFRVIKPAYRTMDNENGNDPVVFSFDLNNLQRLEYEEDARAYASMALVASEGQGKDRKTLEVGDLDKEGIDRIEVYVDARDIQSDSGTSDDGSGGGGGTGSGNTGSSNELWKPTVTEAGVISWQKTSSTEAPEPQNIKGPKGDKGDPGQDGSAGISAGFGTPTAEIDSSSGKPSVTVTASGPDTEKVFNFSFHGLKGEPGDVGSGNEMSEEQYEEIISKIDYVKLVVDNNETKLDEILEKIEGGGGSSGSGMDFNTWYVVESSGSITRDGEAIGFSVGKTDMPGSASITLGIDINKPETIVLNFATISPYTLCYVYLDNTLLYSKTTTGTSTPTSKSVDVPLKQGVNKLSIQFVRSGTTYSASASVIVPSVVS